METLNQESEALLVALEVVGTMAFAVSGALASRRARMDWFGIVVLGVLVAIGGGTLRDVLLGRFPVSWIEDGWPVPLAAATAVATIVPTIHRSITYQPFTVNGTHAATAADGVVMANTGPSRSMK